MYTCECGFAFSLWNALLIISWLCSLTSECTLCRSCSFSGNFLPLLGSQVDFNSSLWDLAWLPLPSHSPGGSDGKESACNAGDIRYPGFFPGSERFPGEGHGSLLQNSCLGNSMDRGAWWATVHGVTESQWDSTQHTIAIAVHSFIRGHLGRFPVLTIVNSAAVNFAVRVSLNYSFVWINAQEWDC